MILTHDQIVANHGRCLGLLTAVLAIGDMTHDTRKIASELVDEMNAHHKAVKEQLADDSVDASLYRGDSCGYLAAQCKARTLRGLVPTKEQQEAWVAEQQLTDDAKEYMKKLENAEYLECR